MRVCLSIRARTFVRVRRRPACLPLSKCMYVCLYMDMPGHAYCLSVWRVGIPAPKRISSSSVLCMAPSASSSSSLCCFSSLSKSTRVSRSMHTPQESVVPTTLLWCFSLDERELLSPSLFPSVVRILHTTQTRVWAPCTSVYMYSYVDRHGGVCLPCLSCWSSWCVREIVC